MTDIKVFDQSTRRGIILDKWQVDQFSDELKRAESNFEQVDNSLLGRASSDCDITVFDNGAISKVYKLYGRSLLVDVDAQTMTQFYMGLLVLEWLHR